MTPFIIAGEDTTRDEGFRAFNPMLGTAIDPSFAISELQDVAAACAAADAAFDVLAVAPASLRSALLNEIADGIAGLDDRLIVRAIAETGLPRSRLEGERARTIGQLRMFADVALEDAWRGLRIEPALVDRTPLPRPELRLARQPIGPVAVFGASNFPLAFSVAGGDTASALAVGCPVVVKGHPAHPGVSALIGDVIRNAVAAVGLPGGVFSLLAGPSNELGAALVADPRIAAVGFTGSRAGGLALAAIAQNRPIPIPVFAEMSSVNPVILMPAALAARATDLAAAFVASLTFSGGQLCTNPGLVIAVDGPALESFLDAARAAVQTTPAAVMLTGGIAAAYSAGLAALAAAPGVAAEACGAKSTRAGQGEAAIFSVTFDRFVGNAAVREEVFGHTSVIIRCRDIAEVTAAAKTLEGQLTVTVHAEPADYDSVRGLLPLLQRKAGRLIVNGWPTGVEVSPAMVHGGPFPATSDGRSTSVGTLAIERFVRPVCYQDFPEDLLPMSARAA